jgi:hypothetical protein
VYSSRYKRGFEMDRRLLGKILISLSLVSYIFLFVYLGLGQSYETTYVYTGNTSFSGKYIELQKVETHEIEYFPSEMFPENVSQGDTVKICFRYSLDNPQGIIETITIEDYFFKTKKGD